jgi:hypothetical protein
MGVPFNTGILEVWVIGTPHSRGYKSLPVKTGFHYTKVPFKSVFTVFQAVSLTAPNTGVRLVEFMLEELLRVRYVDVNCSPLAQGVILREG